MIQDCSQAVELNPCYVKALFRRAKALEKLDNKKECLEGLRCFWFDLNCFSVICIFLEFVALQDFNLKAIYLTSFNL